MFTEKLAEYAHQAWSGWMRHLFLMSTVNSDGSVTIPASLVKRWTRQMNTPYQMLSSSEQHSDIMEAEKMLKIMTINPSESDLEYRLQQEIKKLYQFFNDAKAMNASQLADEIVEEIVRLENLTTRVCTIPLSEVDKIPKELLEKSEIKRTLKTDN